MNKKKIFITLVILLAISSCNLNRKQTWPDKVKSVPENSFWVGGPDGGNWYSINVDERRSYATIQVYDDQEGNFITSERFISNCFDGIQLPVENLKDQITAFNGERILLHPTKQKDSCWLTCIYSPSKRFYFIEGVYDINTNKIDRYKAGFTLFDSSGRRMESGDYSGMGVKKLSVYWPNSDDSLILDLGSKGTFGYRISSGEIQKVL